MRPTWVGVGVMGGGLPIETSFRLRFGVEGRSGAVESVGGCSVAWLDMTLEFCALLLRTTFVTLLSKLFLPFLGLLIELVGSFSTFGGGRIPATLDERLKDMLRIRRKCRWTIYQSSTAS